MFASGSGALHAEFERAGFVRNVIVTLRALLSMVADILVFWMPQMRDMKAYAFVVHPRDYRDVFRQFPAFQYLPEWLVHWICWQLPPLTLSKIRGARAVSDGREVVGYLLTTSLTPAHMAQRRKHATMMRKVRNLGLFAKKKGARHIGLGALIPSLSRYGQAFRDYLGDEEVPPFVTTGHSLTAFTIFQYLEEMVDNAKRQNEIVRVAIVGAAGSTGSLCSKIIAHWVSDTGRRLELTLLDVNQKKGQLERLRNSLVGIASELNCSISTDLNDLHRSEYVITVTNAPKAIIEPSHVVRGTVIIDDSQPRNTSPELLQHGVQVIDVLATVPGVELQFDFGFEDPDKNLHFTCLAETVLLAITDEAGDFSIGEVNYDRIERLRQLLKRATIRPAAAHSFTRLLKPNEMKGLPNFDKPRLVA